MTTVDAINAARDLSRQALTALEAGRFEGALGLATQAIELHEAEEAPRVIEVEALLRLGRSAEAERAARAALEVPLLGFSPGLLVRLGRILLEKEDAEEAYRILSRAEHTPTAELLWERARAAALARRPTSDILLFMEHAIAADPARRPHDVAVEPAFAHYWRIFIPQHASVWRRHAECDVRALADELLAVAGDAAKANDAETMYRLIEQAQRLDAKLTKARVRSDAHIGAHWNALRMKILVPRSMLDTIRFWS